MNKKYKLIVDKSLEKYGFEIYNDDYLTILDNCVEKILIRLNFLSCSYAIYDYYKNNNLYFYYKADECMISIQINTLLKTIRIKKR
jgi:hypothetical protein